MRIERIEVFGYDLHYIHGTYVMSGGRVVSSLPSTVVRVLTDEEIEGWGEGCPLGQTYLPAFAAGARGGGDSGGGGRGRAGGHFARRPAAGAVPALHRGSPGRGGGDGPLRARPPRRRHPPLSIEARWPPQ